MEPKVIIYIDDSNDKIEQVKALLDLMDENNDKVNCLLYTGVAPRNVNGN